VPHAPPTLFAQKALKKRMRIQKTKARILRVKVVEEEV
jgi:hypothetical protein